MRNGPPSAYEFWLRGDQSCEGIRSDTDRRGFNRTRKLPGFVGLALGWIRAFLLSSLGACSYRRLDRPFFQWSREARRYRYATMRTHLTLIQLSGVSASRIRSCPIVPAGPVPDKGIPPMDSMDSNVRVSGNKHRIKSAAWIQPADFSRAWDSI